jgi:uncharacterized protein DUF2786
MTVTPVAYNCAMVHRVETLPSGVLEKVRGLLAKAESTTFDAEAEALTAKAQELMARHRIERALVDVGAEGPPSQPIARRIQVDDPYSDPKAMLLACIARANGCHAIWSKQEHCSTVFGFADELGAVEELFTSLLIQATAALLRAGSRRDVYGRSRTKRFRRSFLIAFAVRIGERLTAVVDATVDDVSATAGTDLVPILDRRRDAAEAAARAAFPSTARMSTSATDGEGWRAGTAFGSQADLGGPGGLHRMTA